MERIQRKTHSSDQMVQARSGNAIPSGGGGGPTGVPPQIQGRGHSPGAWDADDGLMDAMGLGVQRDGGGGGGDPGAVHQAAAHGVSGAATSLPHLDQIQRSFGPSHDVSGVAAHVGGQAAGACDAIGASAYATGNSVAFKDSPDVHTAAHEAAHVVQQKQGISLYGGVGETGDVHERHADAVADRVVAGQSAADLLTAGSSGGAMSGGVQRQVQRDEPAKPADGAAKPADGAAKPADGAAAPTTPATQKTVDVLLSAIYEEVPGDAKDKVKRATGKEAVWLDPLTMYSNHPQVVRRIIQHGVVAGGGQQTVDTFKAPISEGTAANGRGSITSQLKYAADTSKSFNVTVTNVKDASGAEKIARKTIEREIASIGDVEGITATAEAELAAIDKYKGAKVEITVKDKSTNEAGSTSFNYKVRSNAGIRMDLLAQPVGEKTVKSGGSTIKDSGTVDESGTKTKKSDEAVDVKKTEADKYKKTDTSTETHDVDYYESVAKTLDDYVTKTTTTKKTVVSNLAEKTVGESHSDWSDHAVTSNEKSNHQDYTKDTTSKSETGQKDKENWAAKLRKGVKIAKKVTTIPLVDKIPVIGWFSRKVKGWQLDLIDEGLGLFEEKGKVDYTDVTGKETVNTKGGSTDKTTTDEDVKLTETEKKDYSRRLNEEINESVKDDWERHLKDITETSKTYRSKIKKDSETNVDKNKDETYKKTDVKTDVETDEKHIEKKNQTTIATFETVSTWKFSKPVVQATVVAGDAEVSNTPFGPEPGEAAPGAVAPTPATK